MEPFFYWNLEGEHLFVEPVCWNPTTLSVKVVQASRAAAEQDLRESNVARGESREALKVTAGRLCEGNSLERLIGILIWNH